MNYDNLQQWLSIINSILEHVGDKGWLFGIFYIALIIYFMISTIKILEPCQINHSGTFNTEANTVRLEALDTITRQANGRYSYQSYTTTKNSNLEFTAIQIEAFLEDNQENVKVDYQVETLI
jgi:hypothetical protein